MTDTTNDSQTQTEEVEQNAGAVPESPDTPKRRGRGRPPKDDTAAPAKETAGAAAGTSRPRKTAGKTKMDASVLGKQLVGIHQLAYGFTGQQFPEIIISEQEGQMLAESVSAVCEQYDLSIDGKTGAFLQLLATGAMVYAPRYFAIRKRVRDAAPIDVQSNVVQPGA